MINYSNNHKNLITFKQLNQVQNYFTNSLTSVYRNNRGRSPLLSTIDICSILYIQSIFQILTLKSLYNLLKQFYNDFYKLPSYQNFVLNINKQTKHLPLFLTKDKSKIKIIDSTPLEVCKIQREKRHKIMKSISTKTNNGMRWYYGLKMHILIEPQGSIIDIKITTASTNDSKLHSIFIPKYPNTIYIADKGYLSKDNRRLAGVYNSSIFTPIRKNMTSTELTKDEVKSYSRIRKMVETTFSILKTRYNLVSTLPRSINGYLSHYIRSVFMYQLKFVFNS